MKASFHIVVLSFLMLFVAANVDGQIVRPYPQGEDTVHKNTVLHADPRLAIVTKKRKNKSGVGIYSGKGYRVQIYNGPSRNKANEIKVDFMQHFPGIHMYLTYVSPHFRVKAGDFRTRDDAAGTLREAVDLYGNSCMIVPDIITIHAVKQ